MEDSATVAQARAIYEKFQDERLAQSPLSGMADWVSRGTPPPAQALRDAGYRTDGPLAQDPQHWARKAFIRAWGYAIPCAEAVAALAEGGPWVELGCGTACWAALLRAAGLDVVATDAAAGRSDFGFEIARCAPAQQLSAREAVLAYPERDVFCAWPSPETGWMAEAAALVRPGRRIALVLDARPNITGDAALTETLAQGCELLQTVTLPQFPGIEDRLLIYRRL